MPEPMLLIFELIGTVSFAVSGAMTGLKKKMDLFGIAILGLITAVGGGVIRDLTLGLTPPATFRNPIYAIVALCTAIVIFIPAVRRLIGRKQQLFDNVLLVMDSIGLGIFTVVGIQVAFSASHDYPPFLLIFVGMITGIGGGVLRDILAGDTPYIFVRHFYACASLIGAAVCLILWGWAGESVAMISGATVILILRLLAAHFRWSLPRAQ
ncbi:MAG: trimeric intracellular cation channel family protein [Ruminococcaceae bacterium]|nr:trimeric intracellular cation channel family protein [Oscillospiraceae bacterium]